MSALRDPHQHDDLLNYQLKRLAGIGGAPAIRLCEGRYGVTRKEWRVVAALVECGPMSPSALVGHCIEDEAASLSRVVSSTASKGLVRRSPLPHDRRRATIEVTPAGRRLYASLFPRLAAINRRIMDVLDEQEALLLEDFLRRLTDRARAIHDAGGGVDARADRRHGGSGRVWSEIGESANT